MMRTIRAGLRPAIVCRTFVGTSSLLAPADPYNTARMSHETAKKAKDEDKDDLERERKLRELFAQKIQPNFQQQQQQQYSSGASASGESATNNSGSTAGTATGPFSFATDPNSVQWKFLRLSFFGLSLYLLYTLSNLRNPNSPLMMMQGIPWWQAPVDALVANALVRYIVSFREQRTIKNEYETQCKQNPSLTFTHFLQHAYPNLLAGYRTSQTEVLAALSACFAFSKDLTFIDTVAKAVKKYPRDSKAAIDNVIECLKVDFPQVFAPMIPQPQPVMMMAAAPVGSVMQQQQYYPPQHQSQIVVSQQQQQQLVGQTGASSDGGTIVWNMSSGAGQQPLASSSSSTSM